MEPHVLTRLEAFIRKAIAHARSAEDAAEAQGLLGELFPSPDPQSLAESVRASTNAAEDAAYERVNAPVEPDAEVPASPPKRSKR